MSPASHSLHPLFNPSSVAVIGASTDPHKIGGRTFRYLKDHFSGGPVLPINARYEEVQGVPTVPTIADLPGGVDLAFVIVPAPGVLETVEACAAKGIRTLVIFSSGFAEMSEDGAKDQIRIGEIARDAGIRVVGPNCMGVMNVSLGLWGTFTGSFDYLPPQTGQIGMAAQSGAFGIYAYQLARARGLGLKLWATTGNEVDVDVADCLAYFAEDEGTDVLVAYMEGCRDKDKLVHALELARAKHKPVVVLKVGRSEIGAMAASSHTASLVGSDAVYDAIFKQYGAHRADTIDELVDVAHACSVGHYPTGNKVGLVTVSGGVGVLMADAAEEVGLEVPEMPEPVQKKLKELIPFAGVRNPVDTTAMMLNNLSLIQTNLGIMLEEGGCDSVVCFLSSVGLSPSMMENLNEPLLNLRADFPDATVCLAGQFNSEFTGDLDDAGYLFCEDPNRAVRQIAALTRFAESFRQADQGSAAPDVPTLPPLSAQAVSEVEAKTILGAAGIPVVPETLATDADGAVAAAAGLDGPVVMKIVSPDIQHKSEIGGVLLGIEGENAVRAGFDTLMERARNAEPDAAIEGVLVAPMIRDGVETILGVQRDPVFGPVVMFGLGGIFVEVMKDVTLRVAPFTEAEAQVMIREVKGFPLLDGARGRQPADVDALAATLSKLSLFAAAHADTLETLDINPLLVLPRGQGAVAVDALIVPRSSEEG